MPENDYNAKNISGETTSTIPTQTAYRWTTDLELGASQ